MSRKIAPLQAGATIATKVSYFALKSLGDNILIRKFPNSR